LAAVSDESATPRLRLATVVRGGMGVARELRRREVPAHRWPGAMARIAGFRAARRFTPLLGRERDGIRLVLDTRDVAVGPWTYALGPFAGQTVERALRVLAPGDPGWLRGRTVLEIGANIGTETVAFVLHHGAARVIAVEPAPGNLELLRGNVALNGLEDRVEIHPVALSDADGEVAFGLSRTNPGDHRVEPAGSGGRETIQVPARRLDTLVAEGALSLEGVGLAWIDVQGHEGHLLAGAGTLFDAGIPLVMELWPAALRRAGGLDLVLDCLEARAGALHDLGEGRGALPPRRTPGDLRAWVQDALRSGDEDAATDLLVLPRPA
jgi:FkbM family methyltransferase